MSSSFVHPVRRAAAPAALFCIALAACGGKEAAPIGGTDVNVDQVAPVRGVPDKGMDPAVVAIDVGGEGLCTGTLIAPDIVLTARHCVAHTKSEISCPATSPQIEGDRDPSTLAILAGEDVESAAEVARGMAIVAPGGSVLCDADIALLVLDQVVQGITPMYVREAGVAEGDHVRSVGFGKRSANEPPGVKLLREHVPVLDATFAEFRVGEATCQGDSGGPAFDEADGEIVGIVSRGGPSCDGKDVHNIYTRTDAFYSLIEEAYSLSQAVAESAVTDAGASMAVDAGHHTKDAGKKPKPPKPHAQKLPTDLGAACHSGGECGAGVCVLAHDKQYCSRDCDAYDACPTHTKCSRSIQGDLVCVEK